MTDEMTKQGTGTAVVDSPIPKLTKEQIEQVRKATEEACAKLPPPREDIYAYAEYCRKKRLEEMEKFLCPFCGSKEYEEITGNSGGFGQAFSSPVIGYSCKGCTLHFGDPAKFTHALNHSLKEQEETDHEQSSSSD